MEAEYLRDLANILKIASSCCPAHPRYALPSHIWTPSHRLEHEGKNVTRLASRPNGSGVRGMVMKLIVQILGVRVNSQIN